MMASVAERCAIAEPGAEGQLRAKTVRAAQQQWAALPIRERTACLRRARRLMAARTDAFTAAISPSLTRTAADTLVAEMLPLLEACRFLERRAAGILTTRRLGRRGLPWWLDGVRSRVERVALGQVLVIGPANYPLFLPGVQTLQALVAGNAVVWKPGTGGGAVARLFADAMREAGVPAELLTVAGETAEDGRDALHGVATGARPDKVFFTGSAETGRTILHMLATTATPCVAELSGCDAVIALPSASVERLVDALAFGMRLNGSATCMAPRRLFLVGLPDTMRDQLLKMLRAAFAMMPPLQLEERAHIRLLHLIADARNQGARVSGGAAAGVSAFSPALITEARAEMEIARADVFAPLLSVIEVTDRAELAKAMEYCPFALTASVFGAEAQAEAIATSLAVGTVLINDIIVPTADPRVPFPARRGSGFGSTRGAEGLLEMTVPRSVLVRTSKDTRQYKATTTSHTPFFEGMIRLTHGGTWRERWKGFRQFVAAARTLR
jgi:aldehyde dehydrogenase (NAD+)